MVLAKITILTKDPFRPILMRKQFVFLILIITCVFACSPTSSIGSKEVSQAGSENRILFLTLEVSKTESEPSFKILNQKLVAGTIKRTMPSAIDAPGFYKVVFKNQAGNSLLTVAIENPLEKSVEAPSENGGYIRKDISLEKASAVLRVGYAQQMSSISILKESGELITTLKLPQL